MGDSSESRVSASWRIVFGVVLLVIVETGIFASNSNLTQRYTAGVAVVLAAVALYATFMGNNISKRAVEISDLSVEHSRLQFKIAQPLVSLESESALEIVTETWGVSVKVRLKNYGPGNALFREANFQDYLVVFTPFLIFPLNRQLSTEVARKKQLIMRQRDYQLLLPLSANETVTLTLAYEWDEYIPEDLGNERLSGLGTRGNEHVLRVWYTDVTRKTYHVLNVYLINALNEQIDIGSWRNQPPGIVVASLKIDDIAVEFKDQMDLTVADVRREPDERHGDVHLRDGELGESQRFGQRHEHM